VTVEARCDREALARFGRITPTRGALSVCAKADVAKLRAEDQSLTQELTGIQDGVGELTPDELQRAADIVDRRAAISEAIAAIEASAMSYLPDEKAYAGAMVWLDPDGQMRVERGLVRAEDRQALTKAKRSVAGGRESSPAGRKAHAMSEALRQGLLGYRNSAAQLALASNARVAKILLACQLAAGESAGEAPMPCAIAVNAPAQIGQATKPGSYLCADEERLGRQIADVGRKVMGRKPTDAKSLWGVMANKSDTELDAIIAFGVAKALRLGDGQDEMTGLLLEAMAFDVGAHFTPTAANYFNKVPKEFAIAALVDAGGNVDREALQSMKKADLAVMAERAVKGTGWVPDVMR